MTTIIHKITAAVQNLGKKNGTKLAEADPPSSIKGNEARSKWIDEYNALGEHLVAATAAKVAEKRLKEAKEQLESTFGKAITDLKIGDSVAIQRGPLTTVVNRRNGQTRINRANVINVLTLDYKWNMEDIDKLLNKIEKAPENGALYITPSTTLE